MPLNQINLIFVLYFVTFGFAGMICFPVIDKFGRRKTHLVVSTVHMCAQAIIIFANTLPGKAIGYCLQASCMTKNSLCFTWLFEFMTKEKKSAANSALNILDFLVMIVAGSYFLFVSRETMPLLIGYYSTTLILGWLITTLFIPESPKWLLLQGRRTDAIKSLNYIAKVNGSAHRIAENTQFVECVIAQNMENNESYD